MAIFQGICAGHNILCDTDKVFEFMHTLDEKTDGQGELFKEKRR
jgi:hypothetical protein